MKKELNSPLQTTLASFFTLLFLSGSGRAEKRRERSRPSLPLLHLTEIRCTSIYQLSWAILSWRHTCTSFVANPRYVWCQVFWIGVLYIRYIKRLSFTWNFQALGLGQMEKYILFSDKNRTKYDADLYHLSTKWARVGWVVPSRFSLPVLRKRDDWTIVFEVLLDDMLIKSFWHGFLMFQLPTIHSMSSKVHGVRALGLPRYISVPVHRDIFCRNTNIIS